MEKRTTLWPSSPQSCISSDCIPLIFSYQVPTFLQCQKENHGQKMSRWVQVGSECQEVHIGIESGSKQAPQHLAHNANRLPHGGSLQKWVTFKKPHSTSWGRPGLLSTSGLWCLWLHSLGVSQSLHCPSLCLTVMNCPTMPPLGLNETGTSCWWDPDVSLTIWRVHTHQFIKNQKT